ncbi:MAG: hypothetical protein ACK40G_02720 [Cytophagaceae bacterium]
MHLQLLLIFSILTYSIRENQNLTVKINNWEDIEISSRGANQRKDITNGLGAALKRNDFSIISSFIPQENELEYLRRTIDKKDKYILDNLSAEDLHTNTSKNFESIIERGIYHKLTWNEIELIDQKEVKVNDNFYKVYAALQDMKGITMRISYDTVKIKNKWFLFQGMRVEQCVTVKNNCPVGF